MYLIIYEWIIIQDSLVFDHVVLGFYTFDGFVDDIKKSMVCSTFILIPFVMDKSKNAGLLDRPIQLDTSTMGLKQVYKSSLAIV
jgi:hypothetical protein